MSVTEIILLVLGLLVFILSFLLPAKQKSKTEERIRIDEEQIREVLDKEVEEAKKQIGDVVEETVTYSMEKSERSMERVCNEKIMAINEYSDTVLKQISKNHDEVVFLYDMLNDKHEKLKSTVSEAARTATAVKQTVKDAEISAKEAEEKVKEVQESLISVESPENEKSETVKGQSQETEFVPINPRKVEVVIPAEEQKEAPKKKEVKKPKAEKTDLNLSVPGKAGSQNNNEKILNLHKEGKSNMAIAKELGLGIGEVKLVIDLFEGI